VKRYYAKCLHTNYYGEKDDAITLSVDAKTKKEAEDKIYEKYNIDSIIEFTNVKSIHRYNFEGKRIG
jgi:hypothetical protein